MQLKRGLGRGFESLIPPPIVSEAPPVQESSNYRTLPLDSIVPNRMQPRTIFDEEKIRELAESIKEQGVLQPIIVSPLPDGRYELIAGERRLRASRLAGLETIPVVIKKVDDEALLSLSILENIQREDLNPIEESKAYQELIGQFGYTQDEIAKKLGKSRSAVANSLRLLGLPQAVQDDVAGGRYTTGHARALLTLGSLHEQLKFRERIIRETPTVRDVEKMIQSFISGDKKPARKVVEISSQLNNLAETMKASLGTKVEIIPKGNGGKISIEYYSSQDLDRIYRRIVE